MGVPEEWPSSLRRKQFWCGWTEPGLQAVWHFSYFQPTGVGPVLAGRSAQSIPRTGRVGV
jgi:hypothetical protein